MHVRLTYALNYYLLSYYQRQEQTTAPGRALLSGNIRILRADTLACSASCRVVLGLSLLLSLPSGVH